MKMQRDPCLGRLEKSLVVVSGGSFSGRERKEREGRHSVTSLVTAASVKSGSSECGNSRSIGLTVYLVLLFAYEKQLLLLPLSHPYDILGL